MVILTNERTYPSVRIEVDEDATVTVCLDEFVKFLQFEGYSKAGIYSALLQTAAELEDDVTTDVKVLKTCEYSVTLKG